MDQKEANIDSLMQGKNNFQKDNYREWDIFQYKSLDLKIYYTIKTDFKKLETSDIIFSNNNILKI